MSRPAVLLLEKFMTSFMEMSAQQDVHSQVPQASVISKASVPSSRPTPVRRLCCSWVWSAARF